jgi:hypothetical protein
MHCRLGAEGTVSKKFDGTGDLQEAAADAIQEGAACVIGATGGRVISVGLSNHDPPQRTAAQRACASRCYAAV